MTVNERAEEKTELTNSGFDFSQIEKKLKDEEALKNTSWQELLREYEPWLVTEFIGHFLECTPEQQARWKEAVNRCQLSVICVLLFASDCFLSSSSSTLRAAT